MMTYEKIEMNSQIMFGKMKFLASNNPCVIRESRI